MEFAKLTSEGINVSELAKGTYVLKAMVANRPTTIRFLKE
jgi:hypothetical protein